MYIRMQQEKGGQTSADMELILQESDESANKY